MRHVFAQFRGNIKLDAFPGSARNSSGGLNLPGPFDHVGFWPTKASSWSMSDAKLISFARDGVSKTFRFIGVVFRLAFFRPAKAERTSPCFEPVCSSTYFGIAFLCSFFD